MPRRALLIGAELDGLSGVARDLDAIAGALKERGFAIERCDGEATRAGILTAYERLIDVTGPDDAAVVYYSGHGGFVQAPDGDVDRAELMDMQFIAPLDYHESNDDDFRGITSVELSVLLRRLSEKTQNATVILDCCHAGHMSRDVRLTVKALRHLPPYERLRAHLDRLRAAGHLRTELRRRPNNAMRIVACAPEQSAFEYGGVDGESIGVFTESLVQVLAEAGSEAVTWATVMDRVRQRTLMLSPSQRPEAEGPSSRLLFETVEADPLATLRVTPLGDDRVGLPGALLLEVKRGDEFVVMPPDAVGRDDARKVGDLVVDRIVGFAAEGSVTFRPEWTKAPIGAVAYRTKALPQALPVRLPPTSAIADLVRAEPLLRAAAPDEEWLAEVRVDAAGHLTVHDRIGPLHEPRPADRVGVEQVVRDLRAIAQATGLRGLAAKEDWALDADVAVEWGHVRQGWKAPLDTKGSVVRAGDPVYISVRNNEKFSVYVSLIDIGVSGRISVLTKFSPGGRRLAPGKSYTLGLDDYDGTLTGERLVWPEGLDPGRARPETVLVLVTDEPQDVTVLEQPGVAQHKGLVSPLQQLLDQVATGATRDFPQSRGSVAKYDMHTIEFELVPDDGPFLVEERPDPATLALTARGGAPMTVAVRLDELIIHRNRALFGADIRLDVVVLTGGGPIHQPVYRVRTERFSNIRDGQALPLDRVLLYHGPAVDFLDIAIWVSRDAKGSVALSDMLADKLGSTEVQQALLALAGTVVAAPQAAAVAAVLGAGAVVVNLAYHLLRGAVGDVIGVYRGSMLAHERFGVGRHPDTDVRLVQDFSLAYTIENVE